MKSCTSISGGKTSAYLAANYPTDYNVFALVRTNDRSCLYPDAKLRSLVEDRIQKPFIGTLEDDTIIHTILDLEQHIGKKINWCSGTTYDELLDQTNVGLLPNPTARFCTTELKLQPMFHWWAQNVGKVVEMQIGFRANETRRMHNMLSRTDENGYMKLRVTFEKNSRGQNKWEHIPWQKPVFPLIENSIYRDQIEEYWKDKPVRFARLNNCVGCFHRNPILLKKLHNEQPNKIEWFADKEQNLGKGVWRREYKYADILKHKLQLELSFDDFSECDSGYCGL
jgi:hypothetical protein